MRIDRLKIFDKKGSNLNLSFIPDLKLSFSTSSPYARGAEGYAITDFTGIISDSVISNSGWEYNEDVQVSMTDPITGDPSLLSASDVSVYYKDVSIFNPDAVNSKGIDYLEFGLSGDFGYPTNRFVGALFTSPISVGLVEVEHLTIFMEDFDGKYIRPFDPTNSTLVFSFYGGNEEIQMFEVDTDTQIITWTDEIIFDISQYVENEPIVVNIGFKSEEEGVFERVLNVYHRIDGEDYGIGQFVINSESIGEDERFTTLIDNFGLPDPVNIKHIFKETDINEELPDWQILNYKRKHIILEHDKILPYVGTYKALINAMKWLGYEDIKVKEWFRNAKDNKKLSLYIPYEAKDRSETLLRFSPEERKNLKKLNQLSLIYCITRETDQVDEWGVPIIEECYQYSINEILIKLKSLKEWLEKNIIGVNARIIDVTGEGIYIERYYNTIYSTQDKGIRGSYSMSLTPITSYSNSELISGDSSINLSLAELSKLRIEDFEGLRFIDLVQYCWNPSNGAFSINDSSALADDPSTICVSGTFLYPLWDLYSMQWVASVSKSDSAVLDSSMVSSPLWIYDNDLKFYNLYDTVSVFDPSSYLVITLEEAYLRDASVDSWEDSISYSIYPNYYIDVYSGNSQTLVSDASYAIISGSGNIIKKGDSSTYNIVGEPYYFIPDISTVIEASSDTRIQSTTSFGYIAESSTGEKYYFSSEISLRPHINSLLKYEVDENFGVPLLSLENYKWRDASGDITYISGKKYLDILNGKIGMSKFTLEPSSLIGDSSIYRREDYFINFNFDDASLDEQNISLNIVYSSPTFPLYLYDPSIYYHVGPNEALILDNSIYNLSVNFTGNYNVEVFGWNGDNTVFYNNMKTPYPVWNKYPTILSYINELYINETPLSVLSPSDVSDLVNNNFLPIYDPQFPLYGLMLKYDLDGFPYLQIPKFSYYMDSPDPSSISRLVNLTERCTSINTGTGAILWDPDYQKIFTGDIINLVKTTSWDFNLIGEVSANVSYADSTIGQATLDFIPSEFQIDPSSRIWVLNDTRREILQIFNNFNDKTLDADISTYDFQVNQLVNIIIKDTCTGYEWGSAFRVLDVSILPDASYYGIRHILDGNIPQFVQDNSTRYSISAKHSFSSFSDFSIPVRSSYEESGNVNIYLDDKYFHQYYLDSTFAYINLPFDPDNLIDSWYDPSTDFALIDTSLYGYSRSLNVDISTLVIFDSWYDPSNYLLNGRNIWSMFRNKDKSLIFRINNKSFPYIFRDSGVFDIQIESYDSFGNIKTKYFEGLITVNNE